MMNAAARSIDHPVMLGSTLVVATVMGLAVKATAGMRGQTVRELARDALEAPGNVLVGSTPQS